MQLKNKFEVFKKSNTFEPLQTNHHPLMPQLLQELEQEQYIPFNKIKMRYAAFPEYQNQVSLIITQDEKTTTLIIEPRPEVEILTKGAWGLRGKHFAA